MPPVSAPCKADLEGWGQPAWLNLSPVTWDYPGMARNFLASAAGIRVLSMNWPQRSRVGKKAYEILCTGLFTAAENYSQTPAAGILNNGACFWRGD